MSEETHDAAVRGPVAIKTAVLVSGAFGWLLTVSMCFCLTDFEGILNSPTGLPAAQIFLNAGGRTGGTVMWAFAILVQFFTGCSAMLADTRMAYAFARDNALPFSEFLAKVNPYTHTPVNAVWFVVFFSISLNLIAIGSTETALAIFSVTAPALDISYVSVILAHQIYKHKVKFIEGPFTLGRWGTLINYIAVVWVLFISTILFFPSQLPVTPANMYEPPHRVRNRIMLTTLSQELCNLCGSFYCRIRLGVVVGCSQRVRLDFLLDEVARTDKSPSKYTGPQTNDIINEIPGEDNDEDCEESDDFSV
jgi:amino acid transporter